MGGQTGFPISHDQTVALLVLILVLVSVLVGLSLGSLRRRFDQTPTPPRDRQRPATDSVPTPDWLETVGAIEQENRSLNRDLTVLLDFGKQVLTQHEKEREIILQLAQVIRDLFEPEDILILFTDSRGRDWGDRRLVLVHRTGVGPGPQLRLRIPFGEGPIGQVAESPSVKSERDFTTQAGFHTRASADLGPEHQIPQLCAPLTIDNRTTLGVVALFGVRRRRKNDKQILGFVAHLGATALVQVRLLQRTKNLADEDGLTRIFNKRAFLERLASLISGAAKTGSRFSILLIDIDHFKNYNDVNGHIEGDDALRTTARLLKENLRRGDVAARFGGEEFVILFPELDKEHALEAGEKLRRVVEAAKYPHEDRQPGGRLTISGGVASYPLDGQSQRELLAAADDALYRAKREGRNRVLAYEQHYFCSGEEPTAPRGEVEDTPTADIEPVGPRTTR